jgi:hypothetical protein
MLTWGFCLFVGWLLGVAAIGITFLVWAWKRGEFQIAARAGDQEHTGAEPDAVLYGAGSKYSSKPAVTRG